jgi:hypothetical protein
VRLSVAITGFESSEQAVTDENAVLKIQPRFVAVVETNAWGWQTSTFVENKLGEFVNEVYGGEIEMEMTPRNDGRFYVWTSQDGRKAFALQQDSLVFFGNDESAIERCQAVKRGEADAIAKSPKLNDEDADRIAFGFISTEGIGQLANIAGVSLAMKASEEEEVKGFVATVLPEILRNSVKEATWSVTKVDGGVEDKFAISLDDESARVLSETLAPADRDSTGLTDFVPEGATSATRYLLRDPQIAWRSVVLTARKKTDDTSGSLIAAFSGSLFEPYGVEDSEGFLNAVGSQLVTVKIGGDSDDAVVIANVKDAAKLRASVAKEINFARAGDDVLGAKLWKSDDGELAAALIGEQIVIGDAEIVTKCLEAKQAHSNPAIVQQLNASVATSTTIGQDLDSAGKIADLFGERKNENQPTQSSYRTETRFNKNGIERRTTSDFGVIGSILSQIAEE